MWVRLFSSIQSQPKAVFNHDKLFLRSEDERLFVFDLLFADGRIDSPCQQFSLNIF